MLSLQIVPCTLQVIGAGWDRQLHIWEDTQDEEIIKKSRTLKGHKYVPHLLNSSSGVCESAHGRHPEQNVPEDILKICLEPNKGIEAHFGPVDLRY